MKNLIREIEQRIARLEKANTRTSNPRNAGLKQAGSGLKSVQSMLPGVTDRQANHFLHALSSSILDGAVATKQETLIKGEIEVEPDTFIHPSSPSYPVLDTINGVVGSKTMMKLKVDLKDLERLAKMKLNNFYPSKGSSTKILCNALTKNIENNILRNMNSVELDLVFGESQFEIEKSLNEYTNISQIEVLEYDYEVKEIFRDSKSQLTVIVVAQIEYDVTVVFDEDAMEMDRY